MRMNYVQRLALLGVFVHLLFLAGGLVRADGDPTQTRQDFSADPRWDGLNNRTDKTPCRTTWQDFGYSPNTANAGGAPGEIGGLMQVAADLACYAKRLPKPLTFKDRISASGKVAFPDRRTGGAFLTGFFNADTASGWRTSNSLAMRLDDRGGDERTGVLHAHIEYCTDRWRAGGDFLSIRGASNGKKELKEFPIAGVHRWAFSYDPDGRNGQGAVTFTFDGDQVVMPLDPGHKDDGAVFNRFGLFNVMKSSDNRVVAFLDDVTINGQTDDFTRDPGWEQQGNRRKYEDCIVRPRFDFGYSPTSFAGGAPGELGGLVFRGDSLKPHMMAFYGDRLEPLTIDSPLTASGKVCLKRGISDSTTLLGWFHAEDSLTAGDGSKALPRSFLGVMVEGPSSEGFLFGPAYRAGGEYAQWRGPVILPDGRPHRWSLRYDPSAADGRGRITVHLDDKSVGLDLGQGHRAQGARFNRFGIITTCIDGNYQIIYFDDLAYTARPAK
jgi:hypothetical protein